MSPLALNAFSANPSLCPTPSPASLTMSATQGDTALFDYLRRIDGLSPDRLEVPQSDLIAALEQIPPEVADSLRFAARRIQDYQS